MDTTANTTDENGKRNPDAIRGVMLTSISNDSIVNAKEVLNRKAYILEVIMMVAILALAIILSVSDLRMTPQQSHTGHQCGKGRLQMRMISK